MNLLNNKRFIFIYWIEILLRENFLILLLLLILIFQPIKKLVPHDGSEISDIALRHAILFIQISNVEIIIINIIEEDVISPSTLLSFIRKEEGGGLIQSKEDLHNMMEGAIKKIVRK